MDSKQENSERTIITTRVFPVSRELVFKAWTDPVHLAAWWGPKGFRNTFYEFDLRPSGVWDFMMHGPDGTEYRNKSVFVEIVVPEKIVFDHVSGHQFRVTATFEKEGEKNTRLTFQMVFESAEECQRVREFVVPANEQNFDRLEAELKRM